MARVSIHMPEPASCTECAHVFVGKKKKKTKIVKKWSVETFSRVLVSTTAMYVKNAAQGPTYFPKYCANKKGFLPGS